MAHILENLVEQTSTSTGAETLVLSGTVYAPLRSFASVLADGDTTEAMVVNRNAPTERQAAIYRYAAGTLTFVRRLDEPGGDPVAFGAGLKSVTMAPLAQRGEWIVVSAAFEAYPADRLRVDTSAGEVAVTVPAGPADGDPPICLADHAGTWPTHNLVLLGSFVGGATSVRCRDSASFHLRPFGGAWRVCI